MIKSFKDNVTKNVWDRKRVKGFQGEVLKEEFLDPMGVTPYALAKSLFIDPPGIAAIIKGKRKRMS